jgi:hypothetical protein
MEYIIGSSVILGVTVYIMVLVLAAISIKVIDYVANKNK